MIGLILLVFAFVFAVIAAIFITVVNRPPVNIHFGWLAVAFYILSILLGAAGVK
jgi:lipopolysaccharide export LptBFGC system permease protein LptF